MSLVDIFVPCYNYGRYLDDCISSIRLQDIADVRILIIDDASEDETVQAATLLASGDPRIEISRHSSNAGHIATYNEGLSWVQAPYGLLLSADDALAPGALARAVEVMEAEPSIGLVHGRSVRFNGASLPKLSQTEGGPLSYRCIEGTEFLLERCRRPANPIETATAIFRTSTQKKVGSYRTELPHSGDLEMWLRFASVSDLAYVSNVQAFTRLHQANMQHSYNNRRSFLDFEQRALAFQFLHKEGPGDHRLPRHQYELARRELAVEALWAAASAFENGESGISYRLMQTAVSIWPSVVCSSLFFKSTSRLVLGRQAWRLLAEIARRPQHGARESSRS